MNYLEDWKPYLHTITADNGKEFAGYQQVADNLNINYFCNYSPEINRNGLFVNNF